MVVVVVEEDEDEMETPLDVEEAEAALTTATAVKAIFETILLSNFSSTVLEEELVILRGEPGPPNC